MGTGQALERKGEASKGLFIYFFTPIRSVCAKKKKKKKASHRFWWVGFNEKESWVFCSQLSVSDLEF